MNILKAVEDANRIAIAGHLRPDGDCVGSCNALLHYLRENYKEKEIDAYLEYIPASFHVLEGAEDILTEYDYTRNYDLFIALDSGSLDRLGPAEEFFQQATQTICIDHHISNTNFADANHVVPDASSTCEVLFDLFEEEKISKLVAQSLYLGIAHDTGVFKHSNTKKHTMMVAGSLIEIGGPYSKLIDETFYQRTYDQTQMLGRCLLESILVLDGKIIVSATTKKMMDFYCATPADLDGIIDQLRVTKGVEVAIFIYEIDSLNFKVSMRSNGEVNVSQIATFFGGGGHIKAAGCTMSGTMHDVVNNLTKHIENQLLKLES